MIGYVRVASDYEVVVRGSDNRHPLKSSIVVMKAAKALFVNEIKASQETSI